MSNLITCVVCGGVPVADHVLSDYCGKSDIVIAADAGFDHLKRVNITPDILVGDMDSIAPESFQNVSGVEVVRFPRDKDRSDTEIAVELALTRGADRTIILSGAGLRMDHFLANMSLLAKYPGRAMMADDSSVAFSIGSDCCRCTIDNCDGVVFSVFSFGLSASDITIHGAKWEADGIEMIPGSLGLSNVITADTLTVSVGSGILILTVECGSEHIRFSAIC